MQTHKVILTWEAIYDIANIADYIETKFGKTHLHYRNYSIYKKPFPPSVIFYIIKNPQREIHILRVLREERDWQKLLIEQQHYTYP